MSSLARWWVWLGLLFALATGFASPGVARAADGDPAAINVGETGDAPHFPAGGLKPPELPAGFKAFDGGWIEFGYPPELRKRIQPLIESADRARAAMTERFGVPVLHRVHVRIARTLSEMETLAPAGAAYPEYASGVAYSALGLVLLSAESARPESERLEEVFEHELAHIALYDAVQGRAVPRWFNEGLAIHLSGEATFARMSTLSSATLSGNLLPLGTLIRNFPSDLVATPLAYAQSADLVRFLLRQQTQERFKSLISRIRKDQGFEAALSDAYAFDFATLEFEWQQDVARRYSFWPAFLGGTSLWLVVLLAAVWGWRKRRSEQRKTLDRWAEEEAREDRLRQPAAAHRIHIVLRDADRELVGNLFDSDLSRIEGEVPKVVHEGSVHTLH